MHRPGNRGLHFNPLHREGGDQRRVLRYMEYFDFNPLHREGGDLPNTNTPTPEVISIHSTARVETSLSDKFPNHYCHFNPLHREGGDGAGFLPLRTDSNFNPLHREGGDWLQDQGYKMFKISIHSTARVETPAAYTVPCNFYIFQSTPPRGWRLAALAGSMDVMTIFQSTPPRGWRQQYYTITTTILHHISTNKSYPTPLKSRPTIPAHSQIRSHCANFPVRISP